MDFWRSDYELGNTTSSVLAGLQDEVDSPNVSRDSIDYSSDDPTSELSESLKAKYSPKTSFLAKKRLQAYSAANKLKPGNSKNDNGNEKPQKATFKKVKKTLYPDDAAKAVIRDIEILKKAGFGAPARTTPILPTSLPPELIPVEPFVPISLSKITRSPTKSLCSDMDDENLFKKREIKCRNIRRSETISKRSPSPKNSKNNNKNDNHGKKDRKAYPSNWTEYKELNLDPHKDASLKSKLFKKPRPKDFSFRKYFSFEAPSPPMEIFKCDPKVGDALWIPFQNLRISASKPQILYSTNHQVSSPGYLTREQLFSLITSERKAVIEKLWKSPSKYQPSNRKNTARKWYPRNWKRFDNTEAKLLEKSVGLSFLQNYSDEEEEDEEEEVLEENNERSEIRKDEFFFEKQRIESPSATPERIPLNLESEISEKSNQAENELQRDIKNVNEDICLNHERTPPIQEKEEGEVLSIEETPKDGSEDEYLRTKKELAILEEALKESSVNYVNHTDEASLEKPEKIRKEDRKKDRKKDETKHQEKESKSSPKTVKSKRKKKKKPKDESTEDSDSYEVEKESTKKKKEKKRKKYAKNKPVKKAKKSKTKKKKSKKKKDKYDSESENYETESDIEVDVTKKKKKKMIEKSKKDKTFEESSGKAQSRKSSVDITHEGYEDDVKFFTARFDKEDVKGKVKHKKVDINVTKSIQHKNKTNIDLEELKICSKLDDEKTSKHKPKSDSRESDHLSPSDNIRTKNEKTRCDEKSEADKKRTNEKNNSNEINTKEERKKDEVKVDLLKKNEEYLRDRDKLRERQKKSNEYPPKTKNESGDSLTEKDILEKNETRISQTLLTDIAFKSPEGKEYDEYIKPRTEKTAVKGTERLNLSSEKPNVENKVKPTDHDISNTVKADEHIHSKTVFCEQNNSSTEKLISGKSSIMKPSKNILEEEELEKEKIILSNEKGSLDNKRKLEEKHSSRAQPDWEKLKNKRKRHVDDTVQEQNDKKSKQLSHDFEFKDNTPLFPLEKDLDIVHIKKELIVLTPENNYDVCVETSENQSVSEKINTSWDTDDEHFLNENRPLSSNKKKDPFNLEIPLNIKHFAKREIKVEREDTDISDEIRRTEKHSLDVTVEKKGNEKDTFKELRQDTIRTHEIDHNPSSLKAKRNEKEEDKFDIVQTPPKKRRWDLKSLDSAVSSPKIKIEKPFEVFDIETSTASNDVSLENEYEEFLKAVTKKDKKDNQSHRTNLPIIIESSSDSSAIIEIDKTKPSSKHGLKSEKSPIKNRPVITNLDDLVPEPTKSNHIVDIPTIQIPLPPVKSEKMKPVPVPLPKLEAVFDINKPLINLSLSANVTQNITFSLAPSVSSISTPITSGIDISKTSVEISAPVSKDTVVCMNNIPLPISTHVSTFTSPSLSTINLPDLKLAQPPVSSKSEAFITHGLQENEASSKFSPFKEDSSSSDIFSVEKELQNTPRKQKIVFASLTLPTKKQLLHKPNLNLDDSDDDDQNIIEEMKRKKLEALIEDNKKEVQKEEINKSVTIESKSVDVPNVPMAKSPIVTKQSREETSKKSSPSRSSHSRRELSPRKKSPITKRKDSSPKRRHSPRRRSPRRSPRRRSPISKRSPPRRRSPGRRNNSPRRRRSISPKKRKSPSPRRKRSISPRSRHSPRRNRSPSPKTKNRSISPRSKVSKHSTSSQANQHTKLKDRNRSPSPRQVASPLSGLKRSVADSTISDDQLLQTASQEDYNKTHVSHFQFKDREHEYSSPKRIPLDERINQVLGFDDTANESSSKPTTFTNSEPTTFTNPKPTTFTNPKPTTFTNPKPTSFTNYSFNDQQPYQYSEQYNCIEAQVTVPTMRNASNNQPKRVPQSCYKQVGNMLQIVPNDDLVDISVPQPSFQDQLAHQYKFEQNSTINMDIKPQILQVGNMLQIVPSEMVPTEMIPVPPSQPEVKTEKTEEVLISAPAVPVDKPSAEAAMMQKIGERRAEREKRREERERRKKEKEKRYREKEKDRQAKLKIKTENMIKKALEMEQEEDAEANMSEVNPHQWPPVPMVTHMGSKEAGKSILVTGVTRKLNELFNERMKTKIVQFADGIRPGEGTSPSAGEELLSPPPPKKKLPKEKRYKKMKFGKKNAKKKVKVKIIKRPSSPSGESDSDDNLPPPSPPPGSPPPHIFPPRIKLKPVNNVSAAYLTTIIQTAQQQQHQQHMQQQHQLQQQHHQHQLQQQHLPHQQKLPSQQQLQQPQQQYQPNLFCPPINLLMAPPPPPQGHPSALPPHRLSPHGSVVPPVTSPHGQQSHYHPSLPPPPPPPVSPLDHYSSGPSGPSGHHRHY